MVKALNLVPPREGGIFHVVLEFGLFARPDGPKLPQFPIVSREYSNGHERGKKGAAPVSAP